MGRGARAAGITIVCVLLGALLAAPASAKSVRYAGKTSQHRKVVLQTDPRGVAKSFTIEFRADCNGDRIHGTQGFIRPFRKANGQGFTDHGRYRTKFRHGVVAHIRVRLDGRLVAKDRYKGKFSFKGKYYDKSGRHYATCRGQGIRWVVSR